MIIQQAQVNLGQSLHERSQLLQNEKLSIHTANIDAASRNNLLRQRLIYEQQDSFQFSHQQKQHFQSTSQVTDGHHQKLHHQDKTSAEMMKVSLVGEAAIIASHKAFPASDQHGVEVEGVAEISFHKQLHYQAEQKSTFLADGKVKLADGREIDFNLFTSFQSQTQIDIETKASLTLTQMQDPLVINFGSDTVVLTDQYFEFDLNSDGDDENLSKLGHGSGYLVLDLNDDGVVNDGSELFGPQSGNGFADLAQYDEDGNGWIDEQDSVFEKLQLWLNESDDSSLVSLAQKGVGAIYLGHAEQNQILRSNSGETLGQVKSAGIVLMENGEVKTAQALDLAERTDLDAIETSPEFEASLMEIGQSFNEIQQQKEALGLRLDGMGRQSWLQQGAPVRELPEWQQQAQETKNFFEELQERIQKMIEDRKALLEKIQIKYSV